MANPNFSPAVTVFRKLHESGCFVIPNPWDIGSARILCSLGFKALAGTSAGFAFSRGLPDTVSSLSVDDVVSHVRQLVHATPLPVNADFQAGYGSNPEQLAINVRDCLQTGVAGLSIEDATGDPAHPLYEQHIAVERLRAARGAIDQSRTGAILTARCEAYLVGLPDCEKLVLERLIAFADAGADCLFAPGVRDPDAISRMVRAVAPTPINVIVSSPDPALSVRHLGDLGVRRISVGSALARVAYGSLISAAKQIATNGEFNSLGNAATFQQMSDFFDRRWA